MACKLPMAQKDWIRAKIMEQVVQKQLRLSEAIKKLKISIRQAKRILKRYRLKGDEGLATRESRGTLTSSHISGYTRYSNSSIRTTTLILDRPWQPRNVPLCKTCRSIMKQCGAGLCQRHRKRTTCRRRMDSKLCFCQLVQFDGSHHDWFEGRRPNCCLMNMVDDATGSTHWGYIHTQEHILLWIP